MNYSQIDASLFQTIAHLCKYWCSKYQIFHVIEFE